MPEKEDRRLRIGVLGCGPIAQAAHFEACTKARNADLFAICDVDAGLRERMRATHAPAKAYGDYGAMLADPDVEAVIIAIADAFHVKCSIDALRAGKHVLCEKPLGVAVEEVEELRQAAAETGRLVQVGHMKRFDAGLQAAHAFISAEMGQMLAFKAWYCDSTHRYAMTDAAQPLIVAGSHVRRPPGNPKADLQRYYMLAHGSHLVDTARYLAGPIRSVEARLSERFGAYCWFIDVDFASGALGHLDLTVAVRMDWHEGFQIYGESGCVLGRTYNPWYFKSSDVEIFREADASWHRVLGADGHFYRRQVEAFADSILHGAPMTGADIEDGIASVRAMVAIAQSAASGRPVALPSVSGSV
ncbi:MAG: Gfo/Idh/MocA family oxidoreductase [Methylobacteriaceae bacterium]|nr:Gfo/Idh/MocA family oxidoreductase [Methylobacteriaceae bacterium]